MRCLFLPGRDLAQETTLVDGADHHHLTVVLRMRVGERLTVLDNSGLAAQAEIHAIEKRATLLRLLHAVEAAPEPPAHITVAQALGKGDKFEQVLQHGTEVGASAFIPLLTERTVVRLDARAGADKLERWRLVAKGAAEQSGRARIPEIGNVTTLDRLLPALADYDAAVLLHPGAPPVRHAQDRPAPRVLLMVGPEGGFSAAEVEAAEAAGARVASIGPYVLRTETAALAAVAQLLYAADSFVTDPPARA